MNVLVCVKHVPDTETRVKVAPDGLHLDLAEANWVMNPYDEFAVEEALRLKEKLGGEVTVLTAGDEESTKTLRQALAMGADKAVRVSEPALDGRDATAVARLLAAAAKRNPFDLVLCGKMAVDDDNQQVGTLLGEFLGIPSVSVVTHLAIEGQGVTARREIEGGVESVKTSLPCVITCQKGLNEPRYPSLKGIMMAKKKEVATFSAADLGVDPAAVGGASATFVLRKLELPPPRPEGKVLAGETADQVKELVRLLREEAKAI